VRFLSCSNRSIRIMMLWPRRHRISRDSARRA
jgi:hypothetical protein